MKLTKPVKVSRWVSEDSSLPRGGTDFTYPRAAGCKIGPSP